MRAREVVLDDAGEVSEEIAALLGMEVAEDTSRPELYELRPTVDGRRATARLAAGFHLAAP